MVEDTDELPLTVVPRESWVTGVGRLGGVRAQPWEAVVAPLGM